MADWDDEPEETEEAETQKTGKEYYTFVIHYPNLKKTHFLPQVNMLDNKGKPIMSNYGKSQTRTEDATRENVGRKKIAKWTTKTDVLSQLPPTRKSICNSLKAFFTKSEVAIWYHNANVDECSQFGGPHLHVILKSEETSGGHYRQLRNVKTLRTLKQKLSDDGGYFRSQGVRKLRNLIAHLDKAPRVYMGTNSSSIYKARNTAPPDEETLEGVYSDDEDTLDESESVDREWTGFEDDAPSTSKQDEWDDDADLEQPPKKKQKVSYTVTDEMVSLTRKLCIYYNAYTAPDVWKRVNEPSQRGVRAEKFKSLWYRMSTKTSIGKWMDIVKAQLQAEWVHKNMVDCVGWYCQNVAHNHIKYESPQSSYEIWMEWVQDQGLKPIDYIREIVDILDKTHPKYNTICLIGDSNSGKTLMMTTPLREIMRFCGQPSNRASNGDFVFMDFPNKRLLIFDECILDPSNMEDMKLILGGEKFKTNVKYSSVHIDVDRTPVMMTGNKDPWILAHQAKEAFLNRMFYHKTKAIPQLAQIEKQLSPKMWWYILQNYDSKVPLTVDECMELPDCVHDDIHFDYDPHTEDPLNSQ